VASAGAAATASIRIYVGSARAASKTGPAPLRPDGRTIKLTGEMREAEARVHRGGVAILSLLAFRPHRNQVRRAHLEGRL
jgi:hypothetical protein